MHQGVLLELLGEHVHDAGMIGQQALYRHRPAGSLGGAFDQVIGVLGRTDDAQLHLVGGRRSLRELDVPRGLFGERDLQVPSDQNAGVKFGNSGLSIEPCCTR